MGKMGGSSFFWGGNGWFLKRTVGEWGIHPWTSLRTVQGTEALVLVEAPDHPRQLDAVQHQAPALQQVHVPSPKGSGNPDVALLFGPPPGKKKIGVRGVPFFLG